MGTFNQPSMNNNVLPHIVIIHQYILSLPSAHLHHVESRRYPRPPVKSQSQPFLLIAFLQVKLALSSPTSHSARTDPNALPQGWHPKCALEMGFRTWDKSFLPISHTRATLSPLWLRPFFFWKTRSGWCPRGPLFPPPLPQPTTAPPSLAGALVPRWWNGTSMQVWPQSYQSSTAPVQIMCVPPVHNPVFEIDIGRVDRSQQPRPHHPVKSRPAQPPVIRLAMWQ